VAKFIDLSVILSPKGHHKVKAEITYMSHEQSAHALASSYGLKPCDFREGKYAAIERITLGTHDTTHLDAPWHFYPSSEGKPSKTIDQIPLEWCYSDGVVLDFHHKNKGEGITAKEVEAALERIGYQLKPLDIVLIRTDVYKHYLKPGYENMHPGMTADSTLWLIEQGIKVMGIDAWGWDRPHDIMAKELKAGKKDRFWEAHYLGKEREYCHLERLANLDKIPVPFGFKVAVFPIKIEGASAGWVRAVAILEDKGYRE
jgi:kynurenine formamidase